MLSTNGLPTTNDLIIMIETINILLNMTKPFTALSLILIGSASKRPKNFWVGLIAIVEEPDICNDMFDSLYYTKI
jgi:hypothetical protein